MRGKGRVAGSAERNEMVLDLAHKYYFEEPHVRFVQELALDLFDRLKPLHGLAHPDRELLAHAALLHDIGYFIDDKKHHKHAAYLVEHDGLMRSYPEEQRRLLALLVRNHRKKPAPETFRLKHADQQRVLALSALLRVADVLDHEHEGQARIHHCQVRSGSVMIEVSGVPASLPDEAWERKADFFPLAFQRAAVLHVRPHEGAMV